MKWNIKNENKGFTLIEVIISVLILAFVVAPFLSSFIVANQSNASSKRKQEATDIGQLLAEEFKATDFRRLIADEGGYPFEAYSILAPDGSQTGDVGYRFTLQNEDLPQSYNENYNAVITLEPSKSDVNGKSTPVINNSASDSMAVYLSNFYAHDDEVGTNARSRKCTIRIRSEYSSELKLIYYVKLSIRYFDVSGTQIYSVDDDFGELTYTDGKPEIYLIYTPMSDNDEIIINNTISPGILMDEDGNEQKINVYLAMQSINAFRVLNPYNITILSTDMAGNEGARTSVLGNMQEDAALIGDNVYQTDTTSIHTNVTPTDMENLIEMKKKDTLYDMKIVVNYDGKNVTTIKSTKNISDKGDAE